MIYLIQNIADGLTKIGMTKKDDAKNRLSNLQVGTADTLRLVGKIPGGEAEEGWLHEHFRAYWVSGEWFDLPAGVIEQVRDEDDYIGDRRSGRQMMFRFEERASVYEFRIIVQAKDKVA